MRPNLLKQRALEGKPAFGTMINAASPLVAEFLGLCGYQFVVVDLQHGENEIPAEGDVKILVSKKL